jgi:hypothetical protein
MSHSVTGVEGTTYYPRQVGHLLADKRLREVYPDEVVRSLQQELDSGGHTTADHICVPALCGIAFGAPTVIHRTRRLGREARSARRKALYDEYVAKGLIPSKAERHRGVGQTTVLSSIVAFIRRSDADVPHITLSVETGIWAKNYAEPDYDADNDGTDHDEADTSSSRSTSPSVLPLPEYDGSDMTDEEKAADDRFTAEESMWDQKFRQAKAQCAADTKSRRPRQVPTHTAAGSSASSFAEQLLRTSTASNGVRRNADRRGNGAQKSVSSHDEAVRQLTRSVSTPVLPGKPKAYAPSLGRLTSRRPLHSVPSDDEEPQSRKSAPPAPISSQPSIAIQEPEVASTRNEGSLERSAAPTPNPLPLVNPIPLSSPSLPAAIAHIEPAAALDDCNDRHSSSPPQPSEPETTAPSPRVASQSPVVEGGRAPSSAAVTSPDNNTATGPDGGNATPEINLTPSPTVLTLSVDEAMQSPPLALPRTDERTAAEPSGTPSLPRAHDETAPTSSPQTPNVEGAASLVPLQSVSGFAPLPPNTDTDDGTVTPKHRRRFQPTAESLAALNASFERRLNQQQAAHQQSATLLNQLMRLRKPQDFVLLDEPVSLSLPVRLEPEQHPVEVKAATTVTPSTTVVPPSKPTEEPSNAVQRSQPAAPAVPATGTPAPNSDVAEGTPPKQTEEKTTCCIVS